MLFKRAICPSINYEGTGYQALKVSKKSNDYHINIYTYF